MSTFKPMLAETAVVEKIIFPVYASPKLDGIRCLRTEEGVVSRNLKPIPNRYVRETLEAIENLNGYDGEVLLRDLAAPFNEVSSAIMSRDGEPDFVYVIFDNFNQPSLSYKNRFLLHARLDSKFVKTVPTFLINDQKALDIFEADCLAKGFEGVMIRRADGAERYKFGRSTVKEGFLLKVKQFADAEATIVGFEERMHNANEATTDALGHTERSSHKANMIGRGDLGALLVIAEGFVEPFNIGSGFDDATREHIWKYREEYIGSAVKFKYQPCGTKDAPRFPTFLGFRHENDQ